MTEQERQAYSHLVKGPCRGASSSGSLPAASGGGGGGDDVSGTVCVDSPMQVGSMMYPLADQYVEAAVASVSRSPKEWAELVGGLVGPRSQPLNAFAESPSCCRLFGPGICKHRDFSQDELKQFDVACRHLKA
eukprot:3069478-Alexandrium_andersonii.AAC.1